MASEWLYSRDGEDFGPVSSAELKQLAVTGKLLRTDLLWKEGMADWKPADQFPKLFPDEESASVIIPDEAAEDPLASFKLDVDAAVKKGAKAKATASVADNLVSLQVDVAAAGRKATSKVKSHARTAGKVAVLAAERTKISTVTLPIAYAELGEHCYRSRTHAEEFGELFAKLDAVQAGIAESGKPAEAGGDTIAEKAKAWAEQGMKFAQSQAQGVQAKTLFVQLGKACFNRFGPEAGPEELVTRIQALRDRLSKLDAEVKTGVNKTGGAKGWLMYGGGAMVCLMLIGSCFSEKDSGGKEGIDGSGGRVATSGRRDEGSRDRNENSPEDDLVGCPRGASPKFKEGWATAIKMVKLMDSICRGSRERFVNSLKQDPPAVQESLRASYGRAVWESRARLEENLDQMKSGSDAGRNDPKYDFFHGGVAGYEYGLRNIFRHDG